MIVLCKKKIGASWDISYKHVASPPYLLAYFVTCDVLCMCTHVNTPITCKTQYKKHMKMRKRAVVGFVCKFCIINAVVALALLSVGKFHLCQRKIFSRLLFNNVFSFVCLNIQHSSWSWKIEFQYKGILCKDNC